MAELSEEEFDGLMRHARDGHTEIVLEAVDRPSTVCWPELINTAGDY